MKSEQVYLNLLIEGNQDSFKYLYNQWSGKVYNFVLRLSGGDTYLAEEIVQTVFIKVWENRETIDTSKTFSAYLFTIAKNLLTNIYQRRMQEILYQNRQLPENMYTDNTTEKEVEFRLLDEYINQLIEELPPARKEIYVLSSKQHLSNKEIAEKLQLSEHTVESQLTKAVRYLRTKIKEHYNLTLLLLLSLLNS